MSVAAPASDVEEEHFQIASERIPPAEVLPWLNQPKEQLREEEMLLVETLAARFRISANAARKFVRKIYDVK